MPKLVCNLSIGQKVDIINYINKNWDEILRGGFTYASLTRHLEATFDYPIGYDWLRKSMIELGKTFPKKEKVIDEVPAIEKQHLDTLIRQVNCLVREFGTTVLPEFKSLVNSEDVS